MISEYLIYGLIKTFKYLKILSSWSNSLSLLCLFFNRNHICNFIYIYIIK